MPRYRYVRGVVSALLLVAVAAAAPRAVAAVYDPAWTWYTLSTPHFRIHYHTEVEGEARALAEIAEEVYGPMTELLGWEPRQPTQVTLVDNQDAANGYTTALPYNQVVLFPVRPHLFSTIGDYQGWLRTLFVHEYAHVLGLDPVRGYSKVFRAIFGKVDFPLTPVGALAWFLAAPPNTFLPPWFHEGMATNLETDLTGRGRKGSTLYRMIYRADVAAGSVPPLDRLGGDFPEWPSFSTRYIYGARLLQVVEDEQDPAALGRLVMGHAGRFPFTINSPPRAVTGGDYRRLYARMIRDLEAEYRPEIDRLEAAGTTLVTRLTHSQATSAGPLWDGPGTLVYTAAHTVGPPTLERLDLDSGESTTLATRPGALTRPTWGPDGELVFPRYEVTRPLAGGRYTTDLYAVERSGSGERRLTRGARVPEADYHLASDAYVAVHYVDAQDRLVVLRRVSDGDGDAVGVARVLLAEPGVRYDTPRWSPDGTRVAFSRKTDAGHARLGVLEVGTGQWQLVTPDGANAGFPAWSPDGARLAFAWDRTGIYDLYAVELASGACIRLTRLLGGAFEPDWSPDGQRLAFTGYWADGYDLGVLELVNALGEPTELAPAEPGASLAPPAAPAPPPDAAPAGRPYSAWPRVLPSFWLPDLTADNQGVAPGLWTAGHDPLLRHQYYLSGFWAGQSHRFYGLGLYVNDVSYPTLIAQAHKLPVLYTDLFEVPGDDLDYWEETRGAGVQARLTAPRALRAYSVAVSWAWEEVARLSRLDEDLDGRRALADAAFEGRTNPLALSLLYDSAFPYASRFAVGGPQGGRRLEAVYTLRHEALGAELNRQEGTGLWREYLPLVPPWQTTLALTAKGGTSWGDATAQSAFQLGGSEGEFPVRGQPARVARGERIAVGSAEVRFPLWQLYRGWSDFPLFFSKLHGAVFGDGGRVWGGSDDELRGGAGVELRADTLLGYYLPTTLVVGAARGFGEDGEGQLYVTYRGAF